MRRRHGVVNYVINNVFNNQFDDWAPQVLVDPYEFSIMMNEDQWKCVHASEIITLRAAGSLSDLLEFVCVVLLGQRKGGRHRLNVHSLTQTALADPEMYISTRVRFRKMGMGWDEWGLQTQRGSSNLQKTKTYKMQALRISCLQGSGSERERGIAITGENS